MSLLLNNLNTKYKDFVHRQLTTLDDVPDFDKILTLLHGEDRLLKRDNKEQAMAAALRKLHKEREEKKNSRGTNSGRREKSSGGGRGGNTNNNNNTNAKISKNPASSKYI